MAAKSNIQVRFSIPNDLNSKARAFLAELIMDKIRERTAKSLNKDGEKFPKYSESYKASLDFKVAGKSNKVNLELSGDMLASMSLVSHSIGYIVIGYETDSPYAGQVEGNQIGSYGKPQGNGAKARPFLGLPQSILDVLITQARDEYGIELNNEENNLISDIIKRIALGDGDE